MPYIRPPGAIEFIIFVTVVALFVPFMVDVP